MSASYEGDADIEIQLDGRLLAAKVLDACERDAGLANRLAALVRKSQLKQARRFGNSGSSRGGLHGPWGGGHQ